MLESFQLGWNRLSPEIQTSWLQKGECNSNDPFRLEYDLFDAVFKSWEQIWAQDPKKYVRWFQFGKIVIGIYQL